MTNKDESISKIVKELQKKKFNFDVSTLNDEDSPCVVGEWMSTGCVALDSILGGGLPVGRIVEIYGDNSTGKSLIAAQVAALAQEEGDIAVYADTETAVSLKIMEAVGVDISNLIYSVPDTIEEVFEFFDATIEAKAVANPEKKLVLIWDSIAATSVNQEVAAVYGKATMGRHAQIMSQGLRKIIRKISKGKVCGLFLNQTREKIGIMFGDNVATFGGKAVGFYASIRVELKISNKIKVGKKVIGIMARAYVTKNKVAMPFKRATLPIFFGHGIDDALASFYFLKDAKLLDGQGWYTIPALPDIKKFQKSGFETVYDKHFQEIADLIMKSEVEDTEIEEDDEDTVTNEETEE